MLDISIYKYRIYIYVLCVSKSNKVVLFLMYLKDLMVLGFIYLKLYVDISKFYIINMSGCLELK